ncbi:MAG: NADH:ubiquinone oxidoreductase 24 kDa subunit, mitochondrial precursor [Candidatus Scalindua rubra]|uniref:NADH:ubiquinone oxidoreductase 24 kDa subunit, mitochondrial n=1 Tax=Candidatus Scalindua rubra TaxID=1872076 RepID=A0A1E3X501_9BACT|nr:MAG: NADH:ubiquinone oxidoreductase 24 kDa subunit, mitochondrial precursor [Candidatus Scalindua rubra]
MEKALEAKVEPEVILGWIEKIGSDSSSTVPLLQAVQSEYGYLPRTAMDLIIQNSDITGSQVYGVATFYSQFRLKPVGRHIIRVCHGTACHVSGADRLDTSLRHILNITDEKQDTAENGSYTIEKVACVGCCSQAPVLVISGEVSGNLTGATAQRVLKKHAKQNDEMVTNIM